MSGDGSLMLLIVALVALVVGFAAAFFLSKSRIDGLVRSYDERLSDAKSAADKASAEKEQVQQKLNTVLPLEGEVSALRDSLGAAKASATSLQGEVENLRAANEQANLEIQGFELKIQSREALIREREDALERQRKQFSEDKKQLEDSFAALSKQALAQAQQSFLEVAESKFKDARQVSQKEIDQLLTPMKETLGRLSEHTQQIEKERTSSYAELTTQISSLLKTTSTLSNALRRPEIRGSYGEEVLISIAEQAGLKEGIHFTLQDHKSTEDGNKRPDMVVSVGTSGKIIIDAKNIWSAYEEASAADDPVVRTERLRAHASQVRETIKKLAAKEYSKEFGSSLDMVILFIPNEAAYHAAIREDADLIHYSFDRNVILASPINLFTLLRVVAEGMRKQAAFESALEIAKIGGDLYDGVATFMEHFEGIKKGLDSATTRFDKAMGSLNRSVLPKTTKLKKLGVKTSKQLPEGDSREVLELPVNAVLEAEIVPTLQFDEDEE